MEVQLSETDARIVKDQEFLKTLKVAVTAKGPQHEDREYSVGEFLTDAEELKFREKERIRILNKQMRQRRKRADKEERRFGGRIVLWTFEDMKKGKKIMAKEIETDVENDEAEVVETKKEKKTTKKEKGSSASSRMKHGKMKKGKGEKKARKDRGPRIVDGKIALLEKNNPKREKSKAYKRYELYRKHKTIASYLEAGGKRSSLRYDERHGFIKLSGVTTTKDKE